MKTMPTAMRVLGYQTWFNWGTPDGGVGRRPSDAYLQAGRRLCRALRYVGEGRVRV